MNKSQLLLLLVFILFQQTLFSQSAATTKGANLWSVSGSFTSQSANIHSPFGGDRVTSLNIQLTYLQFLVDKLALGPSFGLSRTGQSSSNTSRSWGVGPRLIYFLDHGRPVLTYVGGGIDFIGVRQGGNRVSKGFGTQLLVGTMIRRDHLGVFFELGFQTQNVKGSFEREKGKAFYFSVGFAGFLF